MNPLQAKVDKFQFIVEIVPLNSHINKLSK